MNTNFNKQQNADTIAAFLFIQRLTHDIKESDIKSPLDKLVFDIRKLLGSRVNILTNKFLSIKNLNKDNIKQYINSFNPKGYNGFKRMEDKLNEDGTMDILDKINLITEASSKKNLPSAIKRSKSRAMGLKHIAFDNYEDKNGKSYIWNPKTKDFEKGDVELKNFGQSKHEVNSEDMKKAQSIIDKAKRDLGEMLGGGSILDLLADNMSGDWSLDDLRKLLAEMGYKRKLIDDKGDKYHQYIKD